MSKVDAKLVAAIAAALSATMVSAKSTKGKKVAKVDKTEWLADFDAEVVRKFTKAGYKNVVNRETVLTYGKVKDNGEVTGWLGKGRRVKKGEKAIKVSTGRGAMPLFHIDQTEVIAPQAEQHVPA